jgi:hypothetical protein
LRTLSMLTYVLAIMFPPKQRSSPSFLSVSNPQ